MSIASAEPSNPGKPLKCSSGTHKCNRAVRQVRVIRVCFDLPQSNKRYIHKNDIKYRVPVYPGLLFVFRAFFFWFVLITPHQRLGVRVPGLRWTGRRGCTPTIAQRRKGGQSSRKKNEKNLFFWTYSVLTLAVCEWRAAVPGMKPLRLPCAPLARSSGRRRLKPPRAPMCTHKCQ